MFEYYGTSTWGRLFSHSESQVWSLYIALKRLPVVGWKSEVFNKKHQKYMSIIFYMNIDMDEKIHIVLLTVVS